MFSLDSLKEYVKKHPETTGEQVLKMIDAIGYLVDQEFTPEDYEANCPAESMKGEENGN